MPVLRQIFSGVRFKIIVMDHLQGDEGDHRKENGPDEFSAVRHDHPAAGARAEPLPGVKPRSAQF